MTFAQRRGILRAYARCRLRRDDAPTPLLGTSWNLAMVRLWLATFRED